VNETPRPPLTTTTSILPAMVVLAVAVGTLVLFTVLNLVTNTAVRHAPTTVPIVVGGLGTDATNPALAGCVRGGSPPPDIASALLLPVRTTPAGATRHPNSGAGDYDCLRTLATGANAGQVLGFYQAHLEALGWDLFSRGSSSGGAQLLFQKAGSDTFYWVVGVTIDASRASGSTWTYRIYQNSSAI
jgi:hypothetical protein